MIVYLSGPIDQATREEALDWRTTAAKALREKGVGVFDPAAAFRCDLDTPVPGGNERHIVQIDLHAVELADVLLVRETGTPTCGTYIEVGVAWARGKRIIVWEDGRADLPDFLLGVADHVCFPVADVVRCVLRQE